MTTLTINDFTIWKFPNGEWGVKINSGLHPSNTEEINLDFKWEDPLKPDFILPILMGAAIRQVYGRIRILRMPYLPYLRQDRSFEHGIPIISSVVAKMLVTTFGRIETLQAHSIPCPAVSSINFNPCLHTILQTDSNNLWLAKPDENSPHPDYFLNRSENTIYFSKKREDEKITLECLTPFINLSRIDSGKIVIFDDLCDGGATFIECARQLKEMGFKEIVLCVAHGLFTNGINHLFENGIDKIITTDSACRYEPNEKLIILDAFKEMKA